MTSSRPSRRLTPRPVRWLAALLVVVALPAGLTARALHFALLRSEPVARQELEAPPETLRVWFSQVPAAGVSRLTLWVGKTEVPLEATTIDAETRSLAAVPKNPLGPAVYRLVWRGAGDDGHVMTGEIPFTVVTPGAR